MRAAYTQELLDRATAYVGQPLSRRRYDDGLTEISQLYADITGEAVGKCRQCQYSDYLAVVTAYIREATRSLHPELMADSKYTFAPGFANEQIADGRYTKVVTAENLTDQDAEYLLKLGYEHVIVLKPGQESLLAGASEQTEGGEGEQDAEPQPTEREKELQQQLGTLKGQYETEQKAHNETLNKLSEVNSQKSVAEAALTAEKRAHTTTKGLLTKAQTELARKTTAPPTSAAPAEPVTTAPSTASTATDGPAPVAPAPPAAPAEGTADN